MLQYSVNLFCDGELDPGLAGKRQKGAASSDAFSDHLHAFQNLGEGASLAKLYADIAVAALRPGAGQDEIAQARKAAERLLARTKGYGQARHFGEAARDQRRQRIGTEPDALANSRRDGDNVFHCASELDAEHVVVGIQAKIGRGEFFLEFGPQIVITPNGGREERERVITRCNYNGSRLTARHLGGEGRT